MSLRGLQYEELFIRMGGMQRVSTRGPLLKFKNGQDN
jgi:hypothetical protein